MDALRAYAVSLRDKGDGHGTDWALVAADAFKVAFHCLDQVPGDDRAAKVMRRAEGGLYNRLAGNPDDGTAFPVGGPSEADPGALPRTEPRSNPDLSR